MTIRLEIAGEDGRQFAQNLMGVFQIFGAIPAGQTPAKPVNPSEQPEAPRADADAVVAEPVDPPKRPRGRPRKEEAPTIEANANTTDAEAKAAETIAEQLQGSLAEPEASAGGAAESSSGAIDDDAINPETGKPWTNDEARKLAVQLTEIAGVANPDDELARQKAFREVLNVYSEKVARFRDIPDEGLPAVVRFVRAKLAEAGAS